MASRVPLLVRAYRDLSDNVTRWFLIKSKTPFVAIIDRKPARNGMESGPGAHKLKNFTEPQGIIKNIKSFVNMIA